MTDLIGHSQQPDPTAWERAVLQIRADPRHQRLVLDAYYDDPLMNAAERYWSGEEWRAVRSLLPAAKGMALDLGAGRGIASFALARDGFSVTALEPDPSPIVGAQAIRALAAESGLPISVVCECSERLCFPDQIFDLVFARAVLHHVNDLRATCRELFRVLKPGGILLAIREHVISRTEDLPEFFDRHPLHKLYGGENAFLLDQYVDALSSAGFRVTRVIAPLQSAVNYSPHTRSSLVAEIAARANLAVRGSGSVIERLLRAPVVWPVAVSLLTRIDRRPGRLYSFVAVRP
jgi:SAM-dependent methyltransferase